MVLRSNWLRTLAPVLAFLLFLGGATASAQTTLRITRSIENPGAYTPGETVDVRVTFLRQGGTAQVTQLGLTESLPSGWTFDGLVSGSVPQIPPANGAGGQLNFGWINIPQSFPAVFVYRIRSSDGSRGSKPVAGRAVYSVSGGLTQFSSNVVTLVSQEEGTGEGAVDGEGEPAEGEGVAGDADVTLARVIEGDGSYNPGGKLDVTITLTNETDANVTQLGLLETMPDGWSFDRVVSGSLPQLQPNSGRTGDLAFAWIFIPAFPFSLTYRLNVPADSTGTKTLSGVVIYSSGGAQQFSPETESNIPEGQVVAEGEGEGGGGNEGEPDPDTEVVLTRSSLNNNFYTPGQPVEMQVTLDYTGSAPVQQLGLEELVPNGWEFGGFSGGDPPPIAPQPGDMGTLGFAYLTVPSFPTTFTYLLSAATGSVGDLSILGQGLYAFGNEQERTRVVTTTLQSTFEAEGEAQDGLTLRRIPASETYTAGTTIDITVNLTFVGTEPLTTLGFEETLPSGWTFNSVVSSNPPPVVPAQGETGTVFFAWIDPPTLPKAVTYRLNVDAASTGDQQITGVGRYRTDGEELTSNQETTTLTEPVVEGEGEGVVEGEGEGGNTGTDGPVVLERSIITGNGYLPGDIVEVRLDITQTENLSFLAFGIQETLPEGFAFDSVLTTPLPPIRPSAGDRGVLNFAYIIPPGLPLSIIYRLRADPDATGSKVLTGKVQYRLEGPPQETLPVETELLELSPPDLLVCAIEMPSTLYTGQDFSFVATLLNQGRSGISPGWQDCVYISTDNVFGGDTQINCYTQPDRVDPNSQYYIQDRIEVPGLTPGNYFIFVRADDGAGVDETDETNNVFTPFPVTIGSVNYSVTAQHLIRVSNEGVGSVVLRGSTNDFFFGGPVPNAPVLVDLTLHGVTRTFSATTNNIGAFEIPFTPLPTEAGRYSVGGRHPGVPSSTEQDSFSLNLMRIAYDGAIVSLAPNLSLGVTAQVENLGEAPLTSVGVSVQDVPAGVTAQASITSAIAGNASAQLTITLTATDAPGASGVMQVVVANAQGVNSTLFLPYQVLDGVPNFTVLPGQPLPGAVPGQQTVYEFEVRNIGGGTAEDFSVVPPQTPWVSVVAPALPFNLRAQQGTRVVLQLTPPADQALGEIEDELFLSFDGDTLVPISLGISVVAEDRGGLDITVTDETTLTTSPDFRVAQATVLLRNPETGNVVSERSSTSTGEIQFRNIVAGVYDVEGRKPGYGVFRDVVVIDPGAIGSYPIVMARNFTQPLWEVQPTLAQNAPAFVDGTTVDATAPGPQVVVEPAVIDLETLFEAVATVELTITNEGPDPARNVQLQLSDQTNIELTPLVTSLGDLASGASVTVPVSASIIAPDDGEVFDCVVTGSLGVSYGWLRGNTPVMRAFPIALRLPRIECAESRPSYGYLPPTRDGKVPYTPAPLFVEGIISPGLKAVPPAPREQGILSGMWESITSLLPGVSALWSAPPVQVSSLSLEAVAPPVILGGLDTLLDWEGVRPGQADAALDPLPDASVLKATLSFSTGRVRVEEAFDITLGLENTDDALISGVGLELRFFDDNDVIETRSFDLTETSLRSINNISGTGVVAPGAPASARLRYVPFFSAARTRSKLYRVEPKLTFTHDGETQTRNLLPFNLLVDVQLTTTMQLFTPPELFGDDPLTAPIEPGQAFPVGVYVRNDSTDTLGEVQANRVEPGLEIIDDGGINPFKATRLSSDDPSEAPGIRASIGSIEATERAGAVFNFVPESSGDLQSLFNVLSWESPGRGRRTLLPTDVENFILIHAARLNVGSEDGKPDLLVDLDGDAELIPDQVIFSNTNPVNLPSATNVVVTPSATIPNAFDVTSTMPIFVGYLRAPLPPGSDPNLARVEKSNGSALRQENVWATQRAVRQEGGGVANELFVNIVDVSSNGRYTIFMGAGIVPNLPPEANAGGDQSVFSGQTVTLDGRGSFDPEEEDLTFSWEIIEAPSGSTSSLSSTGAASPQLSPDRRGVYRIELTVSDGNATDSDITTVEVGNRSPTAQTSGDLQAPAGSTVTLDASTSTDPEGDTLAFVWTVLTQPTGANVQIINPTNSKPTVTLPLTGNYVFRVIASDSPSSSSVAEQRVTVVNQAPIANAGPDQSARVNDRIILDGSNSLDPDGGVLSYSWTFVSTPTGSNAIVQTPTRDNASFTVDRQGDYVVRLTVSDGIASSLDEINISTSNSAPIADPGPPLAAQVGETILLDGSDSFDPDGDNLRFTWTLTEKPSASTAVLNNRTTATPSFRLDLPGNYAAQLVVSDGSLSSSPSTINVSTDNTPPQANAGPDQSASVGQNITLNGSGSTDADGDQMLFIWTFRSRPSGSAAVLSNPNSVSPVFTVDVPGTYVAELKTFDGRTTSAADTVSISTVNTPPSASAGPDRAARIGETVTLDGGASTDTDGNPLTYAWTLTSKPATSTAFLGNPTTKTPTITIDEAGAYVIRLLVNDGTLTSAPDTIVVTTLNSPPTANAGPDQSRSVGDRVELDGSASVDPDGDTVAYSWRFTSVPEGSSTGISNANSVSPSFVVDRPGTFVVALVATDGTDESEPDTVIVTTDNAAPVANAGNDVGGTVGQRVRLDGSASIDTDGDTLTFAWSLVSSPSGSAAVLEDATDSEPALTLDVPGDYVVQLIVNDGFASSPPDTVTISTSNTPPIANAGSDRSALLNQTITLDGGASSDEDDDTLTYRWAFVSRPTGSAAVLTNSTAQAASFVVDVQGDYIVQLIVKDGLLDSAPDTVRISTTNTAPVANAGSNRNATVGTVVQLDGTASSDPDGNTLTFAWSIFSRPTGSTATIANATASRASITVDRAGVFAVRLVVSDGALSSPQVTINITATEPDVEGEGEGQQGCTAPAAPASISASDGIFADRVEVQWPAVTGATEYRVWRGTTNDVAAAAPLTGWVTFTAFDDTTATAAVVPQASGCQGAGDPTFTVFFYWVQARSGEETECESALTGPNAGNRGVPATKSLGSHADVRVGALPLESAGAMSPLFLRVTAASGEIDSFWGTLSGDGFESTEVTWLAVPGSTSDGWVVYTPTEPWADGTLVSFMGGGASTDGALIGPVSMEVLVDAAAQPHDTALLPLGDAAYALLPEAGYAEPRAIAVPLPAGVAADDAALFYLYDDGAGGQWYPAESVAGWLANAPKVQRIDGVDHVFAIVNHGGVVRVAAKARVQTSPAAIPGMGQWGDVLAWLAIAVVMVASARKVRRA